MSSLLGWSDAALVALVKHEAEEAQKGGAPLTYNPSTLLRLVAIIERAYGS